MNRAYVVRFGKKRGEGAYLQAAGPALASAPRGVIWGDARNMAARFDRGLAFNVAQYVGGRVAEPAPLCNDRASGAGALDDGPRGGDGRR